MKLILYLLLLLTTTTFTSSDIFLPLKKIEPKIPIISNQFQDQIENMYIGKMLLININNQSVCLLPKDKKIALCQQIFALNRYKMLNVHINYTAFSLASSLCVRKPLRFKTLQSAYPDDKITQNMYLCHGRHDPIRTSFIEDNYYSKFYVSSGPKVNSIIVYSYQYNAEDEWYNVSEYLENISINALPNKLIQIREITDELQENIQVVRTNDWKELEYIYHREMNFIPKNDPVCFLTKWQKVELCTYIFSHSYYKNILNMTVSKSGFYYFDPNCVNKNLVMRHQNDLIYNQKVMRCLGRSQMPQGNLFLDKYFEFFYISSGTRRNSIFVYEIEENSKNSAQMITAIHLFEMIENLLFYDMLPINLTEKDVEIESSVTYYQIENILFYASEVQLLMSNLEFYKAKQKTSHKNTSLKRIIKDIEKEIEEYEMKYNQLNIDKKVEDLFKGVMKENKINPFVRKVTERKININE